MKKLTDAEEALAKAKKEVADEAAKKAAEEQAAKELAAAKENAQKDMNAQVVVTQTGKKIKKAVAIQAGKTFKVKAKVKLVDKTKKHISKRHAAKFRYRASDKSIATVTKSGMIKGINKGTCTVYIYAINGNMKKVKVTVK